MTVLAVESVREHQSGAVQDPGRRRQRSDAHVLQSGPRGLAVEAGRTLQVVEAPLVHPQRQLSLLLRVHHRQGAARHHSPRKHTGNHITLHFHTTFRAVLEHF